MFLVFIFLPIFTCGGYFAVEKNAMIDVNKSCIVTIYDQGEEKTFHAGDQVYDQIVNCFQKIIEEAREMPAFGVSLHHETVDAMKSGIWIEFEFGDLQEHGEMFYEKLLFKIEPNLYGFNLIRFYDGKYDGRCYYFDLQDTSRIDDLFELVKNI